MQYPQWLKKSAALEAGIFFAFLSLFLLLNWRLFAAGSEDQLFLYGDNLYSVKDLKALNIEDEYQYVAGMKNDTPEKYGVLISDEDGFLKEIIEKPKEFVGNIINTGPFKFTPEIFEKLPLIQKSSRGEYEITDVISLLAKERKVKVKKIEDYWIDFGKPEDVQKLSDFISHGGIKAVANGIK